MAELSEHETEVGSTEICPRSGNSSHPASEDRECGSLHVDNIACLYK